MDMLQGMRAFVGIAEHGSLTAAGEALGRSLPAMVRTLAALEEELGVVLLRRTTRRQSLTDEGRLFLERARRILADVEETAALLGSGRAEVRGRLRVTAPVFFGQMHVVPAVLEFMAKHPEVEVQLRLHDRMVDLVEENVDVAVRIGPLADSSMIAVPVGAMRRVVVAAPGYLEAAGVPAHPGALREHRCVAVSRGPAEATWRFVEGGRLFSLQVGRGFSTNDVRSGVEACVAGHGAGQFLAYQVAPRVAAGDLEVILEAYEQPALPVSLLYPEGRLLAARTRAFLDALKGALRSVGSTNLRAPASRRSTAVDEN